MNILVTGGAGFVGFHLIIALLNNHHKVICIDNMNEYYDLKLKEDRLQIFKDRIKFYQIDISHKDELEKVFKQEKIDKVCHLAAQAGVRYSLQNPFVYGESNYMGTLNILELSKRYNIKDVIFASTSSIYGMNEKIPFCQDDRVDEPVSIYAASKRGCELLGYTYCHLYGINFIALRFFTVYGQYGRPDMALFKFTKSILKGEKIDVYNNGDMLRDFTYVGDIVDGFVRAIQKTPIGYNIINLGCGNPIQLMKFIDVIEKQLGQVAQKNMLPMQAGDVYRTYADSSKAEQLLGWKAKIPVQEGVKKFVAWYRSYYKV